MSLGRPSKPLFDLLPRGEPGRTASFPSSSAPRPVVIEPKPMHRPAAQSPLRLPQPPEPEPRGTAERQFTIPATAIYIAITAVCLLVIATWVFGVKAGQADVRRRMGQQLARDDSGGPGPKVGAVNQEPEAPANQYVEPVNPPLPPGPGPESTTGRFYAAGGWVDADPREKGLNYLHVASRMTREDAVRAVKYLGSNKVAAAAVPMEVDRGAPGDKNAPLYYVVVLQGMTREQHGEAGARSRIEQSIRSLGARWKKDEHGPSDFSSPYWVKFVR